MQLFDVANGRRVMITSKQIRWAESREQVEVLGENITWMGITTDYWWSYKGVRRRLIVEHTLGWHKDSGVWQRDVECFVVG